MTENAYYTTAQVAAAVGCNPETVRRWAKSGKVKTIRGTGTGREYMMTAEDLKPLLDRLGYDTGTILEALRHPAGTGTEEGGACAMGRLFCLLMTCGAVTQEDLPSKSEQPGRWIGSILVHAMQGSPDRYREVEADVARLMASLTGEDLSPRKAGQEYLSRFWAGFYRQKAADLEDSE